jgi:adenylyltransferase/sulfurtransferase
VQVEPPDESGDEILRFRSERRAITLKGRSFREFSNRVIPLLDGEHSFEEIAANAAGVIDADALETSLMFLAEQGLIRDDADTTLVPSESSRLEPQLNFFHEIAGDAEAVQRRLASSTVSVIGLAGPGAVAAEALAAAGVGEVRFVDPDPVTNADAYLAPAYRDADAGSPRVTVLARRLAEGATSSRLTAFGEPLDDDEAVARAIGDSSFVICALDRGRASIAYKLNRACLQSGTRWISCESGGHTVVVGPGIEPGVTACYLCYTMRGVACADRPEDAFAFQRFLDRRKTDDSARRERLSVSSGLAGNLLALEALKVVGGFGSFATRGGLKVLNLLDLSLQGHVVLRKPWCPACYPPELA